MQSPRKIWSSGNVMGSRKGAGAFITGAVRVRTFSAVVPMIVDAPISEALRVSQTGLHVKPRLAGIVGPWWLRSG
ncbi:MAG: hypothetical protein NVSMB69_21490 [Novosphingobium sp.]